MRKINIPNGMSIRVQIAIVQVKFNEIVLEYALYSEQTIPSIGDDIYIWKEDGSEMDKYIVVKRSFYLSAISGQTITLFVKMKD